MQKTFRQGAVGALLDEYERAMGDFIVLVESIPEDQLTKLIQPLSSDDNCRSIQTILTHVVHAGHGYATSIHNHKGNNKERPPKVLHATSQPYVQDLRSMFSFTEQAFKDIDDSELEEYENARKMKVSWGQYYDIEQLMEHAIVHILRHRRQIEKAMASSDRF